MRRDPALRRLARLHGVQPEYRDIENRWQHVSDGVLLDVLRALGAPVESASDVPDALRSRRLELWRRPLAPILVAWQNQPPHLVVRRPAAQGDEPVRCRLELEDGAVREWTLRPENANGAITHAVEGERITALRFAPRELRDLPFGYHRLLLPDVKAAPRVDRPARAHARVIAAPKRAFPGAGGMRSDDEPHGTERAWGVFLPLYALHTERSWGAGDLTDLQELTEWIGARGGSIVATLPMLAQFLDEPFEPSPYAPVSRLFWNEFFADPAAASGGAPNDGAVELMDSPALRRELDTLRATDLVDYRRVAAAKRGAIERLAAAAFADGRPRAIDAFVAGRPLVEDYARFRATVETRGEPWHGWPDRMRSGEIRGGDYEAARAKYHLYAQWLTALQLEAVADHGRPDGAGLYVDLPLGVHPDGYDAWRERELFVSGMSVGAPPDDLFAGGQDWGFPPQHPDVLRMSGCRHFVDVLRNHMRYADVLRLDHVMSLQRLFWVPHGRGATEGVYVRYPAAALFAILCIESQRHRTMVVGEDLGTVPARVRGAMEQRGIRRMYVAQFEARPDAEPALRRPPANSVASLNTHDMPSFPAFWQGRDLQQQETLGWLDADEAGAQSAARERTRRAVVRCLRGRGRLGEEEDDEAAVRDAWLADIAASDAALALASIDDLLGETEPQNVPGTGAELPNWRRKARASLEELRHDDAVVHALERVDRARRSATKKDGE